MIVEDTNQRDAVEPARDWIGQETPGMDFRWRPRATELFARQLCHIRKVEQAESQVWGCRRDLRQKGPLPPTHVQQRRDAAKGKCRQHFGRHRSLRSRHEPGISRGDLAVLTRPRAITPELRELGPGPIGHAEKRQRIGEVGVEQPVVLDHRQCARICRQRSTVAAQHPPIVSRLFD